MIIIMHAGHALLYLGLLYTDYISLGLLQSLLEIIQRSDTINIPGQDSETVRWICTAHHEQVSGEYQIVQNIFIIVVSNIAS